MATNSNIVKEALSIIGVLDETASLSAEQADNGLSVMNDLLMEWDANDIDIGFFPQTDINAESPIYSEALQTVKFSLAIALSTYYGIDPRPAVVAIAVGGYKRLLRDAIVEKTKEADMTHLSPGAASWRRRYNILEG